MSNGWPEVALEDVCLEIVDCVNKTAPTVDYETPYKMIRTTNVKDGRIDLSAVKYVTEEVYKKWIRRSVPRNGDVILTREAPMGEVGMVKTSQKIFLGQRLMQYRANPGLLDSRFLLYSFQGSFLQGQIMQHEGSGSTVSHIRVPDAMKFKIRLAPLFVQRRIADILGSLDDKIELNRRMNETLEQMAMALYKHWFVDFGPFQDEEFVESELGMIPKGWEVQSIGDVVKVLGGGTPRTAVQEYWENGDVNWFTPTDLTGNKTLFITDSKKKISTEGLNNSSAKLFPPNSIMMTSRATIGEISINRNPASTNQGFIVLIPNENFSLYQIYFWLKTNMDTIMSISNGSTFLEVNRRSFKALPISRAEGIEPYIEQSKAIFDQINTLLLEIDTLTEIRDYLLPRLLSGEIELDEAKKQVEEVV